MDNSMDIHWITFGRPSQVMTRNYDSQTIVNNHQYASLRCFKSASIGHCPILPAHLRIAFPDLRFSFLVGEFVDQFFGLTIHRDANWQFLDCTPTTKAATTRSVGQSYRSISLNVGVSAKNWPLNYQTGYYQIGTINRYYRWVHCHHSSFENQASWHPGVANFWNSSN